MKFIDNFLNTITMYRLLLYILIAYLVIASFFSAAGMLPFSYLSLLVSTLFLLAVSMISNDIFARVYDVHTNTESVYLSSLILSLIVSPARNVHDLVFLGWAATLTTAGKYILNINKKHLFNPVAVSVVLTAFVLGQSATWWVGTAVMFPFVLAGGFLIVRKIQREDLVISFLVAAVGVTLMHDPALYARIFFDTPLVFFATIMLTEPLTTPPTRTLRIMYGALVGLFFTPLLTFMTPELALIAGNIFSYAVSPKEKLLLKLKEKIQMSPDIVDFIFEDHTEFAFAPGQYMEWTLAHKGADARGNRRYFTIASSPTENNIRIGIRFYASASSFKTSLFRMQPGDTIVAGQRAGDFLLPKNPKQKLAFIAGGIGITPFRSQIKYLSDRREVRDIILFYSGSTQSDFVYRDVFDTARETMGLTTVYNATQENGRLDAGKIATYAPDWRERKFFISGPNSMVNAFRSTLRSMGVHENNIVTDFFPGFV